MRVIGPYLSEVRSTRLFRSVASVLTPTRPTATLETWRTKSTNLKGLSPWLVQVVPPLPAQSLSEHAPASVPQIISPFLTLTNSLPYEFLCGIATLPLGVYVIP